MVISVISHDFLGFFHSPGLAARVTWMEIWVGDLLGWRELQGVINSWGMFLWICHFLAKYFLSFSCNYIIRVSDDSKFFLG